MQKSTLFKSTAIALPIVLLASFGVSAAYAAQITGTTSGSSITATAAQEGGMGHGRGGMRGMMGGANDANRTATEAAITANDFAKFQELSANSPFRAITTQAQFDQLVKAHALMKSGDMAGAKTIFDTLGIKAPGGKDGMGHGFGGNQAAHTAVEAGDYTAWKAAMSSFPNQSVLTQELFDKMVQVEKLQKEIHTALGQPRHHYTP
jgi:hypothetical protein